MSNFCLLALVQAEPSMQQNVFYAQPQMGQQPIMMMPSMAGMTPMAGFVGGGAGQFYQQVGPRTTNRFRHLTAQLLNSYF